MVFSQLVGPPRSTRAPCSPLSGCGGLNAWHTTRAGVERKAIEGRRHEITNDPCSASGGALPATEAAPRALLV